MTRTAVFAILALFFAGVFVSLIDGRYDVPAPKPTPAAMPASVSIVDIRRHMREAQEVWDDAYAACIDRERDAHRRESILMRTCSRKADGAALIFDSSLARP